MKHWCIGGLAVLLVLSGCYSFNTITLPERHSDTASVKQIAKEVVKEAVKVRTPPKQEAKPHMATMDQAVLMCPVYVMPVFTGTPDLPFDELIKADRGDPKAVDRIRAEHIDELREYIANFKKQLRTSHNDYLKKCYEQAGMKVPDSNN